MDCTLASGAFPIARDAGGGGVDVNGNLGFRNLLGARRGLRGQFSVQSDNRFSGRGGGVGSLPRAWRRVGVPAAAGVNKKFVRGASVFPSAPFRSSDFAGLRRPRLYGFHTGTGSLSNRKGRGRRSGT